MRSFAGKLSICLIAGALAHSAAAGAQGILSADAPTLLLSAASSRPRAEAELLLGVARAGQRLVAVGDHGVILLSDDEGRTFRQAQTVPVRTTLTAVAFADAMNGWAVGHGGVILHTADGGWTWTLQRHAIGEDRPLFTVHFLDARHGLAAGLWSLLLVTKDGGRTWSPVTLPPPPEGGKADRNLFALFADGNGTLYIAAERGTVLRSDDGGTTWSYLNTGYKGSLWAGCALRDGTLIVGGLRGTIFRSTDGGRHWRAVASGTKSSITHIVAVDERVVAVGLDGTFLQSDDGGITFTVSQREDSLSLTALSATKGGAFQFYSKRGVITERSAATGPMPR
jgi:photosystem II stability/assembly factor-like uncharacterized protein